MQWQLRSLYPYSILSAIFLPSLPFPSMCTSRGEWTWRVNTYWYLKTITSLGSCIVAARSGCFLKTLSDDVVPGWLFWGLHKHLFRFDAAKVRRLSRPRNYFKGFFQKNRVFLIYIKDCARTQPNFCYFLPVEHRWARGAETGVKRHCAREHNI